MTLQIRELSEYWKLTTTLESRVTSGIAVDLGEGAPTTEGNIYFVEFDRSADIPLPKGYVSITDRIAKSERDARKSEALEKARKELAVQYYSNQPQSVTTMRLQRGWSQRRLAEEIRTSQSHVARIESGTEDLRMSTVRKLAAAFGISVADMIGILEANAN